jgi:hypothetical protein
MLCVIDQLVSEMVLLWYSVRLREGSIAYDVHERRGPRRFHWDAESFLPNTKHTTANAAPSAQKSTHSVSTFSSHDLTAQANCGCATSLTSSLHHCSRATENAPNGWTLKFSQCG